jgi:hypothetical protein
MYDDDDVVTFAHLLFVVCFELNKTDLGRLSCKLESNKSV